MGNPTVKRAALSPDDFAVIDTNIFIYLFEDHPTFGTRAEALVDAAASGYFRGVVTPVTMAELVVKPLEKKRPDIADTYRRALRTLRGIELISIDPEIGVMAGALRGAYGYPLPDMFQVACALQYPRPVLITEDTRLKKVNEVEIMTMQAVVG